MIIPVKCFTCGKVLANKYRYYKREVIKRQLTQGKTPEAVEYLSPERTDKTILAEVLDELKLTKICCRRHMITHQDIDPI